MPPAVIETPIEVELAAHAEVIRALGKRVVGDIIEIGGRLTEAKNLAGHGGWLPWLKREFGWRDERTARNYMGVYEAFGSTQIGNTVSDLPDLPLRTFYLLAAPSTPAPARAEVIQRAEAGERLTHAQVKEIVDKAVAEARAAERPAIEAEMARLRREERNEPQDRISTPPCPYRRNGAHWRRWWASVVHSDFTS